MRTLPNISSFTYTLLLLLVSSIGCASDGSADGIPDSAMGDTNDGRKDGGNDVQHYQSGTRIEARVVTTPDGAKALFGWRDTLLDMNCQFGNTADGTVRCVPASVAKLGYYSDSACTIPVAYYSKETSCLTDTPTHASLNGVGASCRDEEYRLITGAIAPTELYRIAALGGDCRDSNFSDDNEYYTVGDLVPMSAFQSATEALE